MGCLGAGTFECHDIGNWVVLVPDVWAPGGLGCLFVHPGAMTFGRWDVRTFGRRDV